MLFTQTVQKTEGWLKELSDRMGWNNSHMAYDGLKGVLHALRDRLSIEEAVKFGAQLPMLVRGFYYDGWVPPSTPVKIHKEKDFIKLTTDHLRNDVVKEGNVEELIHAVFQLIRIHMGEEEAAKLQRILPKPIADLFEESAPLDRI